MTNKEFLQKIGMELKVARIRQGLQLKDVSKICGLCAEAISDVENGKRASLILTYKRIADGLGVELKNIM